MTTHPPLELPIGERLHRVSLDRSSFTKVHSWVDSHWKISDTHLPGGSRVGDAKAACLVVNRGSLYEVSFFVKPSLDCRYSRCWLFWTYGIIFSV